MKCATISTLVIPLVIGCATNSAEEKASDTSQTAWEDSDESEAGGTSSAGGSEDAGTDGGSTDGGSDSGGDTEGGTDSGGSTEGGSDDGGDTDADGAPDEGGVGAACIINEGDWTQPGGSDLGGTPGIYDCGLFCVPEYITILGHEWAWVGDGMCDEEMLGVNLNCADFNFDEGDC